MRKKSFLFILLVIFNLLLLKTNLVSSQTQDLDRWIVAVDTNRIVYKVKMDGSIKTKLFGPIAETDDRVMYIRLSGDGSKILAAIRSTSSNYLCMIDLLENTEKRIFQTPPDMWIWRGDVSHNGECVCCYYVTENGPRTYIMNSDGSNLRPISHESGDYTERPALSPDGKQIAFIQITQSGISSLCVSDLTLTNVRKIYSSTSILMNPCFSYDNQSIYCPIDGELFNIDIYTKKKLQVFDETDVWAVSQSQNGLKIGYVKNDENNKTSLWTVNPNGSGKKRITIPDETNSVGVFISVDGEYIIYTYSEIHQLGKANGEDTRDLTLVIKMTDLTCANWLPQVPPFNPQNLTASLSEKCIKLQWDGSYQGYDPILKFNLYRKKQGETYQLLKGNIGLLYYFDCDVEKDVINYYVVTAIDSQGKESQYSNEVSAKVLNIPGTPPKKNPILLVNGFQVLAHHPLIIWRHYIEKITGHQISYEEYAQGIWIHHLFNPSNAFEAITYQAETLVNKKYDCYLFRILAKDKDHQDVFVSDYSCFGESGKIYNWNRSRQRHQESIITYSWKLKSEIQEIKKLTGAKKVDIIAHSMGGLVSRAYIERKDFDSEYSKKSIFFTPKNYDPIQYNNDVNLLITIGTPHHGTDVSNKYIGYECYKEMSGNSNFLKIINYGEDRKFQITNSDKLNPDVIYITITGIMPPTRTHNNCLNNPNNHISKITESPDIYLVNECIRESTKFAENVIESENYMSFDLFSDGTVPCDESRLYGKSQKLFNYYLLHTDHGQLIHKERFVRMVLLILNEYQTKKMPLKTMKAFWQYYGVGDGPDLDKSLGDIVIHCPVNVIIRDQNNKIVIDSSVYPVYTADGYFYDEINEQYIFYYDEPPDLTIDIQGYEKGEFSFSLKIFDKTLNKIIQYDLKNQPTKSYQVNRYIIEWTAPNQEPVVSIEIDNNGDGEFETKLKAPNPPTLLTANLQDNAVLLRWIAPRGNLNLINSYLIYRVDQEDSAEHFSSKQISVISASQKSFTDYSIEQGKSYTYYVVAVDTQNQPSISSNFVTIATAISPYTIINLRIGSKAASIIKKGHLTNVTLDLAPFTKSERTLVPLRFIAESFGAEVKWTEDKGNTGEGEILIGIEKTDGSKTYIRLHTLVKKAQVVKYKPNSNKPLLGEYLLDVAPFIIRPENRAVVPIRFIAEGFGSEVKWFAETKKIEIYYLP